MMHIVFNAVAPSTSGVRSYIIALTTELPRMYPEVKYTAFVNPDLQQECDVGLPNISIVSRNASGSIQDKLVWEQFLLPRELRRINADLLYTFFASDVFFAPCPTIIRIGNMLPYDSDAMQLESSWRTRLRLQYLRWMSRLSSSTSDGTLVQSSYAAEELGELHGFPNSKLFGINRGFAFDNSTDDSELLENPPDSYILSVSHIFPFKRLIEVVEGYSIAREMRPDMPPLLIAGDFKDSRYVLSLQNRIAELKLTPFVTLLGNVPRNKLYNLIRGSMTTIFSSMVETFPVSLMEQMNIGSPMIVSNRGVMPSFGGDSVLYYNPASPQELSEQLLKLVDSADLRATLKQASKERMSEVTIDWHTALVKRQQLFERLVNANRSKNKLKRLLSAKKLLSDF